MSKMKCNLVKAGNTAIQVTDFLEKLEHLNGVQLIQSLSMIEDIEVCKGIIRQLAVENGRLKSAG